MEYLRNVLFDNIARSILYIKELEDKRAKEVKSGNTEMVIFYSDLICGHNECLVNTRKTYDELTKNS